MMQEAEFEQVLDAKHQAEEFIRTKDYQSAIFCLLPIKSFDISDIYYLLAESFYELKMYV